MSVEEPAHLRRRAINPGTADDLVEYHSPVIAALIKPGQNIPPPIVALESQVVPLVSNLHKSGENVAPLIVTLKKSGKDVAPIIKNLHTSGEDVSPHLFSLHKSGEDVAPLLSSLGETGRDISHVTAAVQRFKQEEALSPIRPDLNNVQGDICFIFPKRREAFLFFRIKGGKIKEFREGLLKLAPQITSATETRININRKAPKEEVTSTGIAFSKSGLEALGETSSLGDPHFDQGSQRHEKDALGDKRQWDAVFDTPGNSHGVILVATKLEETCKKAVQAIKDLFGDSIQVLAELDGRVRNKIGSEHFGWKDGVSQPALRGVTLKPRPGQRVVEPGVLIFGYPGDPLYNVAKEHRRPAFTKDGSFLVFRKLEQNVQFLDYYIDKNWDQAPSHTDKGVELTKQQRKDLFGARLFGRFKSGVPLALCPYIEDEKYATPDEINNFNFTERDPAQGCPLSAHIRKVAPRKLDPFVEKSYLDASVMVRAGIPYGEEISEEEREKFKRLSEDEKENLVCARGLLFACYQSSIHNGFYRLTTLFGNNDWFPLTGLLPTVTGQDPIIGGPPSVARALGPVNIASEGEVTLQVKNPDDVTFEVTGVAKTKPTGFGAFEQKYFVTSRGGEYYFVPSIKTVYAWARKE